VIRNSISMMGMLKKNHRGMQNQQSYQI